MALSTAKAITVLFDQVMETMELDMAMSRTAKVFRPDSATMQNSNNVIWRQVEQSAPVKSGWDMTGQFGNVIELSYPSTLGTPSNDAFQLRADDFRDEQFIKRRGQAAAKKLNADLNNKIATLVRDTGSLFYRKSGTVNGYDFCAEGSTILTERQAWQMSGTSYFISPRTWQRIGSDLAQRGTLSGRPEEAYGTNQVGRDIAGFDVYKSAYMQTLTGGTAATTATVAATISLKPQPSQTVAGQVLPVDYRSGDIALTAGDGAKINVGDVITFANVMALGMLDKTNTNQPMTFKVVAKSTDTITVYPRPIALSDVSLSADEAAYANINTQIAAGAAITRLNTDASIQTNCFWANDSVEVIAGDAPFEELSKLSGWKCVSETLENGLKLYMLYDGAIGTANLQVRVFDWYGLVNCDPTRNGVGILA